MAVEAVVDVSIRKLNGHLIHDSIAFDNVIDQIRDIRIQLRNMGGFLIDAELRTDAGVVDWTTKYLGVLFSVEDEIENYVLSLSARGRRSIGFFQRRGLTLFATVYDFIGPGKSFRRALDRLESEIENLNREKPDQVVDASLQATGNPNPDKQVKLRSASSSALGRSLSSPRSIGSPNGYSRHPKSTATYPDQEGPILFGFTNDQRKLVDRLSKGGKGGGDPAGSPKFTTSVISLVGPAGSGKTSLVQAIYNLQEMKTRFDCRAWVHVPHESIKSSQLLANLLQQVLKSKEGGILNEDQLITRVQESLKDKTFLVVLDHVSDVRLWDEMKSAFPKLDAGSSKVVLDHVGDVPNHVGDVPNHVGGESMVILITRDMNVATSISKCWIHCLDRMCHKHSWELLTKKAGLDQKNGQLDDGLRYQMVKILEKCDGRPLEIVLLGGLLSTKELKWYLSQRDWSQVDILSLSYNDLPPQSKLCLLYVALFPNEVDISVRRLHRLWLAEGFIRQPPVMSEEDTVEKCFDDLAQRNLIKISKFKSDGSPKRCHLPRKIHEYLSPKAQQIGLFYIHRDPQEPVSVHPQLGLRRVVEYVDINNNNPASTFDSSPGPYENLRSYLSFNFQRNDTPAKEVGNFISKIIGKKGYGALRVLDLEGVYKPTLPETLNQLFHLRYLGLRWTFIDYLPKSVGDLPYLETLDLKRTHINSLPSSIWKLKFLRHLNLPEICLDFKQKKGHSSLTELRTLVGLIVDDKSAVEELNKLRELRELGITCQLSSEDLLTWIQKLVKLKFLWLKSKDKMGQPSKINFKPLPNLSELSHMSLLGNIGKLPTSNEFPPNLKVLALSVSRLNDDPMRILSNLQYLSVLRLLADSYLGEKMECPRNGFENLRVLKLWMLKELEEWTVGDGGMPKLKELNLRCCCKLKQLPSQLLHQVTLEELTLTSMPKEFVDNVKLKKQSHTILNITNYKFTPLPVSGKIIRNFGRAFEADDVGN